MKRLFRVNKKKKKKTWLFLHLKAIKQLIIKYLCIYNKYIMWRLSGDEEINNLLFGRLYLNYR